MFRKASRMSSRFNRLLPLAGLLAAGLSISAFAQSTEFPTYTVGEQANGTFVVSNGTIITPAGKQVNLGYAVRAKAVAVNPTGNHTAAVLVMGASQAAVEVIDTQTATVIQNYIALGSDPSGSFTGITYSPDGKWLLFSQDGNSNYDTGGSFVAMTMVGPQGLLEDFVQIPLTYDAKLMNTVYGPVPGLSTVTCYPQSATGTTGSALIPCGVPESTISWLSYGNTVMTTYPGGIAITSDAKTAYVVLDVNNTLAKIDLTATTPKEISDVRVDNLPHSVVLSADNKTAYVSNEGGRVATASDKYQLYSNGTPVVANPGTGSLLNGTVSVVDLSTFKVKTNITVGLHPTGMALWGQYLLVANAYGDDISVIDTTTNTVAYTINLGLPISVPGQSVSAFGAGPNSIAVDSAKHAIYVALYNANAIAVVNPAQGVAKPVKGLIPTAYAPASVALDAADGKLIVANDKGIGAREIGSYHGVYGYNTHQDNGTVSIVPIPNAAALATDTAKVFQNNHWDLAENIAAASGGSKKTDPLVIPAHIGDPSLIKHVFLIIRENRTYDQILGDVTKGDGDPSLAVFGYAPANGTLDTPNAHAIVDRFPLLDNFYDPSRQSADGHNWILQAMAPYSDDIQSPDWVRDYPSNGGDAIAYQPKGNLYNQALAAGVKVKNYGEFVEYNTFNVNGCTPTYATNFCEPTWGQFYADTKAYESGQEQQLQYFNTVGAESPLKAVMSTTVQNYPQFDLGIPDQYRVDVWQQDFQNDVTAGKVPQLEIMWISSDHTGGPVTSDAGQADNDLALGRFVDAISHSPIWKSSAIFIEEDDAQNGVDHIDGHRSPGYVVSPYAVQNSSTADHTFYTQVNMTRTIEQILGIPTMNQSDLVASPMYTVFLPGAPKLTQSDLAPFSHVVNAVPLDQGYSGNDVSKANESSAVKALRAGWMAKKTEIFAGKYHKPDAEDSDTVNHLDWYEATGFTRPYPGEKTVRAASDFNKAAPVKGDGDDD